MRFIVIYISIISLSSAIGAGQVLQDGLTQYKNLDKSRLFNLGGGGSSFNLDNAQYSFGALNSLFGLDTTTGTISFQNGSYITLGIIILIPLTIGLALLFYLIGGAGTGFYDLRRTDLDMTARNMHKSFNPYAIDWETFTILDWIAIAEETWKNFEPGNLECQKRLICEIHQNAPKFGIVAKKMVDLFSYLQFAEVLRLPEEIKSLIEDYLDAADVGRSLKKDCGEVFGSCDFSVKKMVEQVSHNEI